MPGYNTEADYENAIIELFKNDLGYEYVYGPDVERDFKSPLYDTVLEESLYRLNKGLPAKIIQESAGVIDEKSLRTWDSEDVLAVYDALVRAHESINKLALVPESF